MQEMKLPTLDENLIQSYQDKAIKTIKEDSFFQEIIQELKLTDEEIMKSASKFLKYKEDKEKCVTCHGKCQKKPSKIQVELSFDEEKRRFDLEYVYCSYYAAKEEAKRHFLRTDFPIDWLEHDFKELLNNDYASIRANVLSAFLDILDDKRKKGIYLHSPSCLGKSFISLLFASKYINLKGGTASFCSASDLFKEMQDVNFQDREAMKVLMNDLKDVDLLVIDGFGNEYKSDFVRDSFLFPLLESRLKDNKLTIFTSNFTIDEIGEMYSLSKASYPKIRQLKQLIMQLSDSYELKGFPYSL